MRLLVAVMGVSARRGFTKLAVSRREVSAEFVGPPSTSDFTDEFAISAR
jgi:hypothetical protein